jgi:hypothetical protein
MSSNGGIYLKLKGKTDKIKAYLITTSARVCGKVEWETRFQCQLTTVDHAELPTQYFVDFARIIASDPKEVFLTPKIIIDDLREAISLRQKQSLKYKRDNFTSEEAWRKHQQHLNFEAKLEEVSGVFTNGIANHLRRTVSKLVKDNDAKSPVSMFTKLTIHQPTELDSDSETTQGPWCAADGYDETVNNGRSSDPPGLLEAILDLMAHWFQMKAKVSSIITPYTQKKRSALATFLPIDLMFRLIELQTEEFLLIWNDNNEYRKMQEAIYENCPPSGLVGMIYCLYLAIEFGAGTASKDRELEKIEEMHRGAQHLFMPTIRPFLENWIKRDDTEYHRDIYTSQPPLVFGDDINLQNGKVAQYNGNPGAENVTYIFMFKHLVAQDFVEKLCHLGKLNQRCKTSCLPFLDRLTESFSSNIITETISNSDPILLDTFVELYTQLKSYTYRPFDRLQELARPCKRGVGDLEKLLRESFDKEWKLDEIRTLAKDHILHDTVTSKAKLSGYSSPPAFFYNKKNPALCAVNELSMRLRLREAVAEFEEYCPAIRYAFHIFRMLHLSQKSEIAWPDMEHVVNQFGHRTIFGTDSLLSDLGRLDRCVVNLRDVSENSKNLHGFAPVPGSTKLMKILGKEITNDGATTVRDLRGYLLPGMIARKEEEKRQKAEKKKALEADEEKKPEKEEERSKSPSDGTILEDSATKPAQPPVKRGRGRRRSSRSSRSKQQTKPSSQSSNAVLSKVSERLEDETENASRAHDPAHIKYIDALIYAIEGEELDWHFNYLDLYLIALRIVRQAVSRYFEFATGDKNEEEITRIPDHVHELIHEIAIDEKFRAKICPVLKRDIVAILEGVERKCLDDAEEAMETKD